MILFGTQAPGLCRLSTTARRKARSLRTQQFHRDIHDPIRWFISAGDGDKGKRHSNERPNSPYRESSHEFGYRIPPFLRVQLVTICVLAIAGRSPEKSKVASQQLLLSTITTALRLSRFPPESFPFQDAECHPPFLCAVDWQQCGSAVPIRRGLPIALTPIPE